MQERLAALPRPPAWTAVTVLVALLNWRANPYPPPVSGNIDISWITALHVAAHEGLRFGSDFNFVYGPFGFATFPNLFYDDTGLVATVVMAAVYLTAIGLVARATCKAFGLLAGGIATFLVVRLAFVELDVVELLPGILVAAAVIALHRQDGRLPRWQGAAIGVLAAFCELSKLSAGSLALAAVAVLALVPLIDRRLPWRERLGLAWPPLAGAAGGLVFLWLLAGETLWDLAPYLRNAVDFVLGNVDAVALSTPGLGDEYVWAAVTGAALALAVVLDGRGMRLAPRVGIALLWALLFLVSFRHGFTRHQPGHVLVFFAPLLLAAAATFPLTSRRWVAALACLPLAAGLWTTTSQTLSQVLTVSTAGAVTQVDVLLPGSERHAMQERIRGQLRRSYAFDPAIVRRLRGETVHFDPYEAAIAWAYPELDWAPAPVLQSYSAYTAHLDDLNADFLAGDEAPRYVLRENVAPDGRNARFESPAYQVELLCRYRQVVTTERWQLLERGRTRCGEPQPLGAERRVPFGEHVPVPAAGDDIVAASFHDFDLPLGDRVKRALLKGRSQWIWLGPGIVNRLVPGHAGNPHVLAIPPCLGWSAMNLDVRDYTEVGIGWVPGLETGAPQEPSYTLRLQRIPFDCSDAARAPGR